MSGTGVKRVGEALKAAADVIAHKADELQLRVNIATQATLDKFHSVENFVDDWEKQLEGLDDFMGQSTNNPPADAAPAFSAGGSAPVKVDVGVYRRTGQDEKDTPTPGRAVE